MAEEAGKAAAAALEPAAVAAGGGSVPKKARFEIGSIGDIVSGEGAGGGQDKDEFDGMSEIPGSLCMNCGGEGTTRMLTTKIPFFREIIISSFDCPTCFWSNNEVIFGGELQEEGVRFELTVSTPEDLNRQVIKSDYAAVGFKEIDFEIPARPHGGEITTVEGLLSTAAERLGYEQPHRMETAPEVGMKVAEVILQLTRMSAGEEESFPFTLYVDDISGNSFVENPYAPNKDAALDTKYYKRTPNQDIQVGLQPSEQAKADGFIDDANPLHAKVQPHMAMEGGQRLLDQIDQANLGKDGGSLLRKEMVNFPEACPNCMKMGVNSMCMTDIPHFKEVIIMGFDCDDCGFRSNEVKGGGAVPPKGTSFTLHVRGKEDFARDILKSDSAMLEIPELELVMQHGTLGGMYTTLEGVLGKCVKNLTDGNPFYNGDSATHHHAQLSAPQVKYMDFMTRLRALVNQELFPFTLVLRDPMGNSFIGALHTDNPAEDEQITIEYYDRTEEEEEDLGLKDMNTEAFEVVPDSYREANAQPEIALHRWGTDHPTGFSKGTETDDVTPTTGFLEPRQPSSSNSNNKTTAASVGSTAAGAAVGATAAAAPSDSPS